MKLHKHKADILILCLLMGVAMFFFAINLFTSHKGNIVQVYSNNQLIASYDINIDKTDSIITEYGSNTIQIKNGKVSVKEASCKNQVCVHHIPIKNDNESIICLPHHLTIKIQNTSQSEVDDIAK